MKVAVLISTYNGEKYLAQQLDSIFNQKCTHEIDIWIRDDGSSDGTLSLIEYYIRKHSNIHLLPSDKNLRSAYSFFELARECGVYDFYSYCDQDDYWHEDKLETAISELMDVELPAIYCCNARVVDEDLVTLGRNVYKTPPYVDFCSIICASFVMGCTMVFNNKLAEKIREVDLPACMEMHDAYLVRVCLTLGGCVIYDHQPHMDYRQHGSNVIGLKTGIKDIFQQRFKFMFLKPDVSIADQSYEIFRLYESEISEEKKKWLLKVAAYRKNVFSRITLAFSSKLKFSRLNQGITIRGSILLGNR